MQILEKLITPKEHLHIFGQDEDGIELGERSDYDAGQVKALLNIFTPRLDKVIAFDKDVHGDHTWISQQALTYRAFTFEEYGALFNTKIEECDFPYYKVFSQVRKAKGGIVFEKQRHALLAEYEYTNEDYIRLLIKEGYEPTLRFFFARAVEARTRSKLSVLLPRIKIFRHVSIIAPTGSGKSILMLTLFFRLQKRYKDFSFVMIDPHGDISPMLKRLSINTTNPERVVYLDPYFQEGYTFTINPFEIATRSSKVIDSQSELIVSIFKEGITAEGADLTLPMKNMLKRAVTFLLHRDGSIMEDLEKLLDGNEELTKEAYQFDSFFNDDFRKPSNKVRQFLKVRIETFLNSSVLKNVLSGHSSLDLLKLLNSSKVLLINLGEMPEISQTILGKLLVAQIRANLRKRKPDTKLHTIMFIDECQCFVTDSYDKVLSQMRKYGLHFVLANQYISQLGTKSATSIRKNTAIKICASDDIDDIKEMIKLPKDASLKDYEFFVKVSGKTVTKFISPNLLIKHKRTHFMTEKEEEQLDAMILERYYKPLGSPNHRQRKASPETTDNDDMQRNDDPSPPFTLLLPNND